MARNNLIDDQLLHVAGGEEAKTQMIEADLKVQFEKLFHSPSRGRHLPEGDIRHPEYRTEGSEATENHIQAGK